MEDPGMTAILAVWSCQEPNLPLCQTGVPADCLPFFFLYHNHPTAVLSLNILYFWEKKSVTLTFLGGEKIIKISNIKSKNLTDYILTLQTQRLYFLFLLLEPVISAGLTSWKLFFLNDSCKETSHLVLKPFLLKPQHTHKILKNNLIASFSFFFTVQPYTACWSAVYLYALHL